MLATAYATPRNGRAAAEILVTALPFLGLTAAMLVALRDGVWLALALSVPPGALLVRLFMIQHDRRDRARVAVLCSASIRGHLLGPEPQSELGAAAIEGSPYFDLPGLLRWLTADIGFHRLQHLSSRIPFVGARASRRTRNSASPRD